MHTKKHHIKKVLSEPLPPVLLPGTPCESAAKETGMEMAVSF